MGYLVCDSCGGYYELAAGESADDFDVCQCGGNLNLHNEVPQSNDSLDEDRDSNSLEDNKNVMICPHCFKHHDSGIFCSNCGSDLISVENGNGFLNRTNLNNQNRTTSPYDEMIPKRIPKRYPKRIPRNSVNTGDMDDDIGPEYYDYEDSNGLKRIIKRISWSGVIIGSVFFVIGSIIMVILAVLFAVSQTDYSVSMSSYLGSQIIIAAIIFLIGLIMISIISGALAGYMSKSHHYNDGALNGFVVGLVAIALMIGSGGSSTAAWTALIAVILYGGLGAAGGVLGVLIRRKQDN